MKLGIWERQSQVRRILVLSSVGALAIVICSVVLQMGTRQVSFWTATSDVLIDIANRFWLLMQSTVLQIAIVAGVFLIIFRNDLPKIGRAVDEFSFGGLTFKLSSRSVQEISAESVEKGLALQAADDKNAKPTEAPSALPDADAVLNVIIKQMVNNYGRAFALFLLENANTPMTAKEIIERLLVVTKDIVASRQGPDLAAFEFVAGAGFLLGISNAAAPVFRLDYAPKIEGEKDVRIIISVKPEVMRMLADKIASPVAVA